MKNSSYFLMRSAAAMGFRAIEIPTSHDAVSHVWTHPPAPFKATVIAKFNTADTDLIDEALNGKRTGKLVNPYGTANQTCMRIYIDLKPDEAA
jgi:hypothetical protein